MYLLYRMLD